MKAITTYTLAALAIFFIPLLVGTAFPGAMTWGFHMAGFLPAGYAAVIGFAAALIALALLLPSTQRTLERLVDSAVRHRYLLFMIVLGGGILASLLLRVRAPLLGDGFFLVKNFSDALHGIAPVYYRNEPLATAYFWLFVNITGPPSTYQQFLNSFLVAEIPLMIIYAWATFVTLRNLGVSDRTFVVGIVLSLAMPWMQLYFGYVETYAVVLAVLSVYVMVTVLWMRGKLGFWMVPVVFLLLFLTHYLALLLLPSLAAATWEEHQRRGWNSALLGIGAAAVLLFLFLSAVQFNVDQFTSSVPHHHYLSLTPPTDPADIDTEAYTMFSPYHFADIGNYLVLMCVPPLVLLIAGCRTGRIAWKSMPWELILSMVLLLPLVLLGLKFDLGAARDWDTLAAFFYPLTILALLSLPPQVDGTVLARCALIIVIVAAQSLCYWLVNARPASMEARVLSLLDPRTVSHGASYTAHLHLAQYYHQEHRDRDAIALWKQYERKYPSEPRAYQNVILNYEKALPVPDDSIALEYARWRAAIPSDTAAARGYRNFCIDRGNALFHSGDYAASASWFESALQIDSTDPAAHNNAGSAYAQQGKRSRAEIHFREAVRLSPGYAEAWYNLATVADEDGRKSDASHFLRIAESLRTLRAWPPVDSTSPHVP